MKKIFSLFLISALIMFSCEEDYEHRPISSDGVNPGALENLKYTPINGGFNISYDLPKDKDLLYVKAIFQNSKGQMSEVKASTYNNKIQILGYGDTQDKTVKLYAVDRSENVSEPVSFTAKPLTSPVRIIQENMAITADWGGATFKWINALKEPISIQLFAKNENGELVDVKTIYSSQSDASFSLRGYNPVPQPFAAVIKDRYDNYSDTIYPGTPDKLLTPWVEERIDKSKFRKIVFANDDDWGRWEGVYEYAFDDNLGNVVHTQGDRPRPSILSVDLGANVVLSRFKLYQRTEQNFSFTHGNPKKYTVYGAKDLPGMDGNLDNWIKLRECESIKPSGLPIGQITDEDVSAAMAGDEFSFDQSVEIRYFRLVVHETWDGAGFVDFTELTFWGINK